MDFNGQEQTRTRKALKALVAFVLAIPTIIALVDICTFGISLNNSTVAPLVKPRVECTNRKLPETEGGYPIYDVDVLAKIPHYLRLGLKSWSRPYRINFEAIDNFTFDGTLEPVLPPNFIKIENRFSTAAHIVKSMHYSHRFVDEDSFKIRFRVIGPQILLGDICPFDFSVRY